MNPGTSSERDSESNESMNLVSVVCQISHSIAALYCETHPYSCNLNYQEWGDRSMLATIALGAAQV